MVGSENKLLSRWIFHAYITYIFHAVLFCTVTPKDLKLQNSMCFSCWKVSVVKHVFPCGRVTSASGRVMSPLPHHIFLKLQIAFPQKRSFFPETYLRRAEVLENLVPFWRCRYIRYRYKYVLVPGSWLMCRPWKDVMHIAPSATSGTSSWPAALLSRFVSYLWLGPPSNLYKPLKFLMW